MTNKFRDCAPPVIKEKLEVKAGTYFEFDIFVTAATGSSDAFDLTGCTLTFFAANDMDNPTATLTKSTNTSGIIIMDAEGGQARIVLESADTLILGENGGFLFYEVRLEDTELRLFTVASGSLILANDLN